MRIVFDPQGALGGSRHRGIGRYTRSFLREFARLGQKHEIYVLLNAMLPDAFDQLKLELHGLVPDDHFITWSAEKPIGGMHFENWSRRALAREIWEEVVASLEPDLLVVSSLFEGAEDDAVSSIPPGRNYVVATICYDLIPMIYRQHYLLHPGMEAHYRRQTEQLRRSDFLLAISQSAADEAVQMLRYPKERVKNIGAAVDAEFAEALEIDMAARFGITRPYMLYVSAFEVRKNHAGLIKAYAALPSQVRETHQLVLGGGVGAIEHLYEIALENGLGEDEVVFTGGINDTELCALYSQSKAVTFPSWHEGFGLPILEAMMFGKAVISSNRSSMPEVVGIAEALFDPFDIKDMTTLIERVLTDKEFRKKLEENAYKRVEAFTWERTARSALEFLEQGVANCPRPRDYNRRFVANALGRVKANSQLVDFPMKTASDHIARTFRRDDRKQLLIDVSRLVIEDAHTGIQRVVRAILASLLKNPPAGWVVEPVHANSNDLGYRYASSFADRFLGIEHPWHNDRLVEVWAGDILCVLDLEPDVLIKQRPILDEWRVRGVEVYTVIYDILPLLLPEYFPDSVGEKIIDKWVRELARHNGAICISSTVADQLNHWMTEHAVTRNASFKLGWFHQGSDIVSSRPTKGIPSSASEIFRIMAERPAALMVGTIEPRKGHEQAIDALEQLWTKGRDIALIIVGKQGWRIDGIAERLRNHPETGKRLFWLDGISDEYLEQLYARSSFLLGASEGEGFGLPLVEAARHDLPLIIRDIPVFQEVANEGALYFPNSKDPLAISDTIETWLELRAQNAHPKPSAVTWLTWEESAKNLIKEMINKRDMKA
jgi:glycosyltransferase involved in cell wall biosynthesis